MPLTLKNFNKSTKTFTISREEKSDMSSGWAYSDDAAGLTAGSTAFDEFFGYSGVRLNTSGVETDEITQEDSGGAGNLDITQLGTLTSGDNVMIKFPMRGIKMTKSGSVVTLSITNEPNKTGYQYYAHCTGTLSNPGTPKDAFYLGAYKSYSSDNVLKSWSGQSPTTSLTQAVSCTRAKANGSGYNIMGYYQRMYVDALYMMKYGNPNSQTVVGIGYTNSSSKRAGGYNNSQISATYGTSSTLPIKLFGLDDWRGNVYEFLGGAYTDASKYLYVTLSGYSGAVSGGESTGSIINYTNSTNIISIVGDNKTMFGPNATVNNSNFDTYYCDYALINAGRLLQSGGAYNSQSQAGVLCLYAYRDATSTPSDCGSRLLYL